MSKWLLIASAPLLALGIYVAQSFAQSSSQGVESFVAGKDYAVIEKPVKTGNPNKIEVTEVFWYGCGHCNNFRPMFSNWEKQQGDELAISHSPAMWNKNMATHARIFYTAAALGKQELMHKDIFDAMHLQKKKLVRDSEIYALFEKHGVSQADFDKTFKSFGVNSMVQQADARAKNFGITGTPEVVINGKYRVSASMTGSQKKMLEVANYLIEKEKQALATKS